MPGLGRAVQQLLNVAVGLTGVQAALGNGDQRFAAAVLRQAQHRAGVAFGEVVVQHKLPLVCGQLQQPQLVGKGGLRHAQALGGFGLGAVPQHHHIPQPLRLFKGVQVGALDVFQQTQRSGTVVGVAAQDGGDGGHLCQLTGAQPPLPCHQLIAFCRLAHRDRLEQTVFPDALRQRRQLLLVKAFPRLKGRWVDLVDGQRE